MSIGIVIFALFLAILPVIFMFAVDYKLSRIIKELKLLNENPTVWKNNRAVER